MTSSSCAVLSLVTACASTGDAVARNDSAMALDSKFRE
jgi:hypothetical protein